MVNGGSLDGLRPNNICSLLLLLNCRGILLFLRGPSGDERARPTSRGLLLPNQHLEGGQPKFFKGQVYFHFWLVLEMGEAPFDDLGVPVALGVNASGVCTLFSLGRALCQQALQLS